MALCVFRFKKGCVNMIVVRSVYANQEDGNYGETFRLRLENELNYLLREGYSFKNIRLSTYYYMEQVHALIIAYKDDDAKINGWARLVTKVSPSLPIKGLGRFFVQTKGVVWYMGTLFFIIIVGLIGWGGKPGCVVAILIILCMLAEIT